MSYPCDPRRSSLANHRSGKTIVIAVCLLVSHGAAQAQGLDWSRSPTSGVWFAETPAPMSWSGAEALARRFGGNLATVRDSADNSWLDATFFSVLSVHRHHWIGLYQDVADPNYAEPNGGWKWSSGAPFTFANWAPSQPDDAGGAQNVARTAGTSGGPSDVWFDASDSAGAEFASGDDLYLEPGALWIFNTSSSLVTFSQIQFAPGTDTAQFATPIASKSVVGGVLEVDDFYISPSALMRVEGPNPLVIMARGRVVIRGKLMCDGNSNPGVGINTSFPTPAEPGSPGQAGGGRGGTGSPGIATSSATGEDGEGAFHVPNAGGRGGEAGWSPLAADAVRRGGGGGGGVFGSSVAAPAGLLGEFWQARIGFDAESGFPNLAAHNGALSGPGPAHGGAIGARPFVDDDPTNDFYGRSVDNAGNVTVGELIRPWAGSGGGGGGDAVRSPSGSFPPPTPLGDEKGAGGGGGGGSCHIMALGRIVFGANGQITARGGTGGGGQNTSFLNRVGGGSGGGSGGHVVLQSAVHIDLRAKPGVVTSSTLDNNWAVDVRGGQGGAGGADSGGAQFTVNGPKETLPIQDACPPGYPAGGVNACRGHVDGAGGDGGPGLVQFHTPLGVLGTNPALADILLPATVPITSLTAPAPLLTDTTGAMHLALDIGDSLGLLELVSDDCDGSGLPDAYEIAIGAAPDIDRDGVIDTCDATVTYCVGAPSAGGCALEMRSTGIPSANAASGFELVVAHVDGQRAGSLFFGLAPSSTPFSNNTMCVAMPRQRLGLLNSGGTAGSCDGELRVDWNAWRAAHPNGLGSPYSAGQVLYAQAWVRDPTLPVRLALSSAHRFTLAQ